jgi:hypothetical protein
VGCRFDGDDCNLGVGDAEGKNKGDGDGTMTLSWYLVFIDEWQQHKGKKKVWSAHWGFIRMFSLKVCF